MIRPFQAKSHGTNIKHYFSWSSVQFLIANHQQTHLEMLHPFSWCLLVILPLARGAGGAHWNYQQEGHGGPDHWPGVCHDGRAQSPINILNPEHTSLPGLTYAGYDEVMASVHLTNDGHSVKFSSSIKIKPAVTGGGLPGDFVFAQGHFHWGNYSGVGSEHLVGGRSFPLELHLVHFNSKYLTIGESLKHEDGLSVIGVMHELSDRDNPYLDPIIESLEQIKNAKAQVETRRGFSLANLLPSDTSSFYRYSGSLTIPGCNEIVTWTILHHHQAVSEHQLARFRAVLDSEGLSMGDNFRPVMPLHGRRVLVTGLEPRITITHNVVQGEKEVEIMNNLWYFNMVPGWAVVLISLGVALNVGGLVYLGTRSSHRYIRVPTEGLQVKPSEVGNTVQGFKITYSGKLEVAWLQQLQ